AAHQHSRSGNEPAAQRSVELRQPRAAPFKQDRRRREWLEDQHLPAPRQVVLLRKSGLRRIFGQRIPFRAVGTLSLPSLGYAAAGGADISLLGLGHRHGVSGTL